MANVTIYEHFEEPNQFGLVKYPADVEKTIAIGATHTLRNQTVYVEICADADCRAGFNTSAVSSGMNITASDRNPFLIQPASGSDRTINFL